MKVAKSLPIGVHGSSKMDRLVIKTEELCKIYKMTQTIADIQRRFMHLIGNEYTLPITSNKGLPGSFLEELLGIPHTPNALDCSDGELKTFPVKKLKKGKLVPKESMAITMLSKEDLQECDFEKSKCYNKMKKMYVVPYYRDGDKVKFMNPKLIDKESSEFEELYNILESDYNEIRKRYVETGELKSEIGKLLQNRTKGAGHGSTSRAFYVRPEFMKQYVPLSS